MTQKQKTPAKAATEARGDTAKRPGKHIRKQHFCKCPRCNFAAPAPLFVPGWLDDLQIRAARYWGAGFGPDLAALSLIELHALGQWLLRQGG